MARLRKRSRKDRNSYERGALHEDQAFPSAPKRLPVVNIYCRRPDGHIKCIRNFAASWAAGVYVRHWIDAHGEYVLRTDRLILFDDGYRLETDGLYFPDLIKSEPPRDDWELPPDLINDPSTAPRADAAIPQRRERRAQAERIHNAVSLKDILPKGMNGRDARIILRQKFQRKGRWEWAQDDPQLQAVKDALEAGE